MYAIDHLEPAPKPWQLQHPTVELGRTGIRISPVGTGTWAWGDRLYWGYRKGDDMSLMETFRACIVGGIRFFDTAEIYGRGRSEKLLGWFVNYSEEDVVIATKFFPYPWRLLKRQLRAALDGSLARLEVDRIDLYQTHFPFPPRSPKTWVDAIANAVEDGHVRAVGVSNYSADQMRRVHEVLARRNIPLASNQVGYSLLNRSAERNGVMDACRELGVTLIAYGPLAEGLLTGKYSVENPPPRLRRMRWAGSRLPKLPPLIGVMREIGQAHGNASPTQVALNWLVARGTVPIPGARSARQVREHAAAMRWHMTPDEVAALDRATVAIEGGGGWSRR